MNTLSYETAKQLAKQIIDEKPEGFKYCGGSQSACFYVPSPEYTGTFTPSSEDLTDPVKSTTGCIVGEILKASGVPHAVLAEGNATFSVFNQLVLKTYIKVQSKAVHFLNCLQYHQDCGESWSNAYDIAVELYEQVSVR